MTTLRAVLARDDGYSMSELLVALALVGIVSGSLMQLIGISMRTFSWASSLEYSQMGARAGLHSVGTDLRYVGSYYSGVTGAGAAVTTATSTTFAFLGDIDANTVVGGVENTLAAAAALGAQQVTVTSANDAAGTPAFGVNGWLYVGNGANREVARITGVAGTVLSLATPLQRAYAVGSLVRSVEAVTYAFDANARTLTRSVNGGAATVIVDNVNALTFSYFDGGNPPSATAAAAQIRQIDVSLTVRQPDGPTRVMVTRIRPISPGT